MFKSYNIKKTENGNKWYERKPETVVENEYEGRCSRVITLRQLKNGNKWYERKPETVVENDM